MFNEPHKIPILEMDPKGFQRHYDRLAALRRDRDNDATDRSLNALRRACQDEHENAMPYILAAARADATLGEMTAVMRQAFGVYQEPLFI